MSITEFVSQCLEVVRDHDTGNKYLWPRVTRDNVSVLLQLAAEQSAVLLNKAPFLVPRGKENVPPEEQAGADEEDRDSCATSVYDQDGSEAEYYDDEVCFSTFRLYLFLSVINAEYFWNMAYSLVY